MAKNSKNNNTNTSNEQLLSSLSKLETALSKVADKLDEFNSNNTSSTSTSSISGGYKFKGFKSYGNIFENKPEQRENFKNYEKDKFEEEKKRTETERNFWLLNRDKIHELALYQIELDNKRRQYEIDFWRRNKDAIKELDDLENSLTEKRELKQLRSKKRAAELEKKTTDSKGRTKSNKEIREIHSKISELFQENTSGRLIGMAASTATNGAAKGADFLASGKKVSISDIGDKIAGVAAQLGPYGQAAAGIVKLITVAVESFDKINAASSKYARSVGGGVAKMEQMKKVSVDVANNINKMGGNAYSFNEILEHTAALSEKTGRVMDHMTTLDFKSLEDLTRYGITPEIINEYDTFAISVEEIDERLTGVYKKAGRHGLNAKAVTDAVNKNLKMAQQYTFAGGLKALERMAEKSVALKYNMESVSKFADKVSTLEGAAQAGAQLSVLGGSFAQMGNPLSLLYGGLQDPERLNDYMLNMVQGMAHWDNNKGQLDLAAADRMRIRAASEATGIDYSDFYNMAMNQEKQNIIGGQIKGDVDDETRQYIQNLATIKADENGNAQAWVKINGKDKLVSSLEASDKEALKKESEAMEEKDKAKIGDVYEQTRTISDTINDWIKWFQQSFFQVILKIAGYDDETIGYASQYKLDTEDTKKLTDRKFDENLVKIALAVASPGTAAITYGLPYLAEKFGFEDPINKINPFSTDKYAAELAQQDKYQKKAIGDIDLPEGIDDKGIIYSTHGTSASDDRLIRASRNEMIMTAKAVQEHGPQLVAWNRDKTPGVRNNFISPIKASENQTNSMSVNPVESSMMGAGNMSIEPLTINPITINVSGTINLAGGGVNKSLDIKELLNDNTFISYLTRQIEKSINFSFNASESQSHMPYTIPYT